jgi:hypothetical protein
VTPEGNASTATASIGTPVKAPAPVRGCDGCTLCCKVMYVPTLQKPSGTWCKHCKTGAGCGIYETRPTECRTFICGYLWFPEITPEWKPAISRMVISTEMTEGTTTIFVDPGRPDAWRRQPYYAALQQWAKRELARQQRLILKVGERNIVMMPDHAVDLGVVKADELILTLPKAGATAQDVAYDVFAVNREAWTRVSLEVAQGLKSPLLTDGLRAGRRLD